MNKEKLEEFNKIYNKRKNEILAKNEKIKKVHELYDKNPDVREFYDLLKEINLRDNMLDIDESALINYATFYLSFKSNDESSSHIYVYHGKFFTEINDNTKTVYYSMEDTISLSSKSISIKHWFQDLETGDYVVIAKEEFNQFVSSNKILNLEDLSFSTYLVEKIKYVKCEFFKLCNEIGIDEAINAIISKYGYKKKEC